MTNFCWRQDSIIGGDPPFGCANERRGVAALANVSPVRILAQAKVRLLDGS